MKILIETSMLTDDDLKLLAIAHAQADDDPTVLPSLQEFSTEVALGLIAELYRRETEAEASG